MPAISSQRETALARDEGRSDASSVSVCAIAASRSGRNRRTVVPRSSALSIRTSPPDWLHEAVDLAQSEPGALALRLGGEERLEHPLQQPPGVCPFPCPRPRWLRNVPARPPRPGRRPPRGGHPPCRSTVVPPSGMASRALMHRFSRALSELVLVAQHVRGPVAQPQIHRDAGPHRAADEVRQPRDQSVRVQRLRVQALPPREGQQSARQPRGTLHRARGHVEVVRHLLGAGIRTAGAAPGAIRSRCPGACC